MCAHAHARAGRGSDLPALKGRYDKLILKCKVPGFHVEEGVGHGWQCSPETGKDSSLNP